MYLLLKTNAFPKIPKQILAENVKKKKKCGQAAQQSLQKWPHVELNSREF